jgi:serine/threonine protein phosphatase PrpC
MNILSAGATDTGNIRTNNEDAYLVQDAAGLFAVADGVGGYEGGEVASRIAVDTLFAALPDLLGDKDRTPPQGFSAAAEREIAAMRSAFTLANQKIRRERELNPKLSSMGTTLTSLLVRNGRAFLVHIGDSRAYLLRSGELRQLTNDHSLVAEQVRAGMLTPLQARTSPYRHVISRALGLQDDILPDTAMQPLQQGDTFLLCTDGLTEMVDDRVIEKILSNASLPDAVRELIGEAKKNGGVDNITAVLVQVREM